MSAAGRPPILTLEMVGKVGEGISRGLTHELAAWYAGTSYTSFKRWQAKGADDYEQGLDSLDRVFWATVKGAEAGLAFDLLGVIQSAVRGGGKDGGAVDDWTARAWILERRLGYVKTERQEVSADVRAKVSGLSDEELEALIAEAGGGPTG